METFREIEGSGTERDKKDNRNHCPIRQCYRVVTLAVNSCVGQNTESKSKRERRMISDVKNYPISQLFDIETNVIYAIPPYQREYTWTKREWEALFDDITESDSAYFLGSIICINQTTDALAVQRLEMVDGQQRMTTISLFFAALYSVLKGFGDQLDDDQKVELINLKRRLILKKGDDQIRVIPQIHNSNKDDYRAILAMNGVIKKVITPPNAGNRKIFRCYRYFQDQIREYSESQSTPLASLLELLNRFLMASLVKIEVLSHSDAYTLFESLNNRGIPLTPIDLIKNKLLAQLEQKESNSIEYHFNNWRTLLEYLGDDYAVQERFFRQYYNGFKKSLSAIIQIPIATKSNLIMIYEKLIHHDATDFMESIIEAGKLYAVILGRNNDEQLQSELEPLSLPLKNLERIQGAPSYLMLLHLLSHRKDYELNTNHLATIIDLLARFFVRRNLTDTPPTRDLNRLFMTTIDKLAALAGSAIVSRP